MTVVVSKLDTCNFSEQRFLDIQAVLLPFLKGCGFRPSSLQWLPAVGPSGQNLTQSPSEPQLSWFKVSAQSEYHGKQTVAVCCASVHFNSTWVPQVSDGLVPHSLDIQLLLSKAC